MVTCKICELRFGYMIVISCTIKFELANMYYYT